MKIPSRLRPRLLAVFPVTCSKPAQLSQTDIPGPVGSGSFGARVICLSNRNLVFCDHEWNSPGRTMKVGAVHLYDVTLLKQISRLTGRMTGEGVGLFVTSPANGNYLVHSGHWCSDSFPEVGAVIWGSGINGVMPCLS